MPVQIPLIRIFLSSPGDVGEERRLAQQVIKDLPNRHVFRDKLKLAAIAWDDLASSTPMEASLTPQEAINQGLPQPAECDITIVIFWSRIGTPLVGADGKSYESGTHWELLNALNSPSKTFIYHRAQKPNLGDPDDPKYDENLAQYRRLQAFLKGDLFYRDGHIIRNVLDYDSPSAFEKRFALDLEKILLDILAALAKEPDARQEPTLPTTPNITIAETASWDPTKSPFPGLHAFTENDAEIFFGRGRETDALVQLVKNNRFVAVVGASGSGKSSLVGAGLIPRLRENAIADETTGSKAWTIIRLKPDVNPFARLYDELIEAFPNKLKPNPMEAARVKKNFLADMTETPEVLLDICAAALENAPKWAEVLFFIDQFEELFTLTDDHLREPFAKMLTAIASSERVRAVVTMRHDFYPKAIELPELAALLNNSLNLPAPKREALYEMIVRPAERSELQIEPHLVDRILDDTGDEPGNLALMAYALDELYKLDDDRILTHDEYELLGGVQGAIGTRAENQFAALGLPESVIQQVFHVLVEVDERGVATRRRADFKPDEAPDEVRDLIYAFADARLLTTSYDEATGVATVEVAHEAILRQWKRLADWIEETQDDQRTISRVKRNARIWDEKGQPEFLLPNAEELKEFHEACERLDVTIDELLLLAFTEPEQERLYRELVALPKDDTSHERRRDIGDRLSVIGDTRQGVGVVHGVPDMLWLPVMGSDGIYKFEFGEFQVPNFFIAKYLTTYAQYQAFVNADDGYENPEWWADMPKDYQPQKLGNQRTKSLNNPRDSISWYQSVAFSRWLNSKLQGVALEHPSGILTIGDNAEVRLPTEWEWQWAAQHGTEKREYPWGKRQDGYANTSEAGLSRAIAVGMYPHGAAECGALDMSGNLREWVLSKYRNPEQIHVDDSSDDRVLRGGAFHGALDFAASGFRNLSLPLNVYDLYGVRCVVSAPLSSRA